LLRANAASQLLAELLDREDAAPEHALYLKPVQPPPPAAILALDPKPDQVVHAVQTAACHVHDPFRLCRPTWRNAARCRGEKLLSTQSTERSSEAT
jgi:hypothetical protein